MLQHGIVQIDRIGVIRWHWFSAPLSGQDFNGSGLWEWVCDLDRHRCRADVGIALTGGDVGVCAYRLNKNIFIAETSLRVRFFCTSNEVMPLQAIAYIVPGILSVLSPRERDVAKLLPFYSSKEIGKQLKIAPGTAETVRQRLSAKVGLSGHSLVSWCAEHREVI